MMRHWAAWRGCVYAWVLVAWTLRDLRVRVGYTLQGNDICVNVTIPCPAGDDVLHVDWDFPCSKR